MCRVDAVLSRQVCGHSSVVPTQELASADVVPRRDGNKEPGDGQNDPTNERNDHCYAENGPDPKRENSSNSLVPRRSRRTNPAVAVAKQCDSPRAVRLERPPLES